MLFAGEHYYPCGGMDDFIICGTMQECMDKFNELVSIKRSAWDWGQIVDHKTLKPEFELRVGADNVEVIPVANKS